jgi:hypothetical protein
LNYFGVERIVLIIGGRSDGDLTQKKQNDVYDYLLSRGFNIMASIYVNYMVKSKSDELDLDYNLQIVKNLDARYFLLLGMRK